jgi:site-specific recombinase XerD
MLTKELDRQIKDCLANISNDNTKRSYTTGLRIFAQWLDLREIDNLILLRYRASLINSTASKATQNSRINALNCLIDYLNKVTNLNLAKLDGIKFNRKIVAGEITIDELNAMELAIKQRPCYNKVDIYFRDRDLAIHWKLRQGLRRSEICNLTLDDLIETKDGFDLIIKGKGNEKQRIITASPTLVDCLWGLVNFEIKNKKVELDGQKHKISLDYSRGLILNNQFKPISDDGIYYLVKKLFGKDISPHTFRRVQCSYLLSQNVDLLAICKQFGWSKSDTAKHYDLRVDDELKHISELFG